MQTFSPASSVNRLRLQEAIRFSGLKHPIKDVALETEQGIFLWEISLLPLKELLRGFLERHLSEGSDPIKRRSHEEILQVVGAGLILRRGPSGPVPHGHQSHLLRVLSQDIFGDGPGHGEAPQDHFIGRACGGLNTRNSRCRAVNNSPAPEKDLPFLNDVRRRVSHVRVLERHLVDFTHQHPFRVFMLQCSGPFRIRFHDQSRGTEMKKEGRTREGPEDIDNDDGPFSGTGPIQTAFANNLHSHAPFSKRFSSFKLKSKIPDFLFESAGGLKMSLSIPWILFTILGDTHSVAGKDALLSTSGGAMPISNNEQTNGRLDGRTTFFKEFLKHPLQIGSILPSSRFLERRIVEAAGVRTAGTIVELGPGTGGTTRAILRAMGQRARLLSIEINPNFHTLVSSMQDHRLIVHLGNALELRNILTRYGLDAPEAVISGIPFSTMTPASGSQIVEAVWSALAPMGRFVAYQLSNRVHSLCRPTMGSGQAEIEPRNLPPVRVYRWEKGDV